MIGNSAEAKNFTTKILSLESKIENSARDEHEDGWEENVYGTYDDGALVEALLSHYRELDDSGYSDRTLKLNHAAFLFRCRRFDESIAKYQRLIESERVALVMLATIYLKLGRVPEAKNYLDAYNDRCIRDGMPFMMSTLDKIRL